jgi:hypothetical protein
MAGRSGGRSVQQKAPLAFASCPFETIAGGQPPELDDDHDHDEELNSAPSLAGGPPDRQQVAAARPAPDEFEPRSQGFTFNQEEARANSLRRDCQRSV